MKGTAKKNGSNEELTVQEWSELWGVLDSLNCNDHQGRISKTASYQKMSKRMQTVQGGGLQSVGKLLKSMPAFKQKSMFVISQENPFVIGWTLLILVLISYTSFSTPLQVAFESETDTFGVQFWVDRAFDILFFIDLGLQFFVSYEDPQSGNQVFNHRLIARHYLSFWFWLDLVSIFPYDLVALFLGNQDLGNLGTLSIIRMFRMLKLFKLASMKQFFKKVEARYALNYNTLHMFKYFGMGIAIIHMIGCGLLIVGNNPPANADDWIESNGFADAEPYFQYLLSLYWAAMTITTIGYGDILMSNKMEYLYAVLSMVAGTMFYGVTMAHMYNTISNMKKEKTIYTKNLTLLNDFMKSVKMPNSLQRKVRDFYARTHEFRATSRQKRVFEMLSPNLQAVVARYVNGTWVVTVPFFRELDGIIIANIAMRLCPHSFSPQEIIIQKLQPIENMIILIKGTVSEGTDVFTVPYFYGSEIILHNTFRSQKRLSALKYSDTYFLSKKNLEEVQKIFPKAKEVIRPYVLRIAFVRTVKQIQKQMISGEIKTVTDYAPKSTKAGIAEVVEWDESSHQGTILAQRFDHLDRRVSNVETQLHNVQHSLGEIKKLVQESIEVRSRKNYVSKEQLLLESLRSKRSVRSSNVLEDLEIYLQQNEEASNTDFLNHTAISDTFRTPEETSIHDAKPSSSGSSISTQYSLEEWL